jgi:glycosyltransferase involved in cell wall biosynthesis
VPLKLLILRAAISRTLLFWKSFMRHYAARSACQRSARHDDKPLTCLNGMDRFFPRVLVLGNQIPHLGSPSAILLYRMFLDWPADRLLAIGPDYHPDATRLACRYEAWVDPWERLERTRFSRWVRTFRTFCNLTALDESQISAKLGAFQPDIVVSLMEFQRFYAGAWQFAKALDRPLVLLVHDLPESFEIHFAVANASQRRRDCAIYRAAALRLPVSDAMERGLFQRYGAHGTVLLPIPSSDPVNVHVARPAATDRLFVVGYAGSLGSRYDAILRPLAAALDGGSIRLNIYSRSAPAWPMGANTIYRGYFEPEALWSQVEAECDALLFAFGRLDARDEGIIRYSFPSKLPEYLRLGLPVLVAAPNYSGVWQWAKAHENCFLFAQPNLESIRAQLSRLNTDLGMRERLGAAARQLYDRHFEPAAMRERFRRLLVDVSRPAATALLASTGHLA